MNALGLWQGQSDSPLSERGQHQARALAAGLRDRRVAALLTSDLARALETAQVVGEVLGLEPRLEPGLREMDVGCWSARSHAEIKERWPADYARVRAGEWQVRPGGGETRREVRLRVQDVLERVRRETRGETVAVVTHLGVLRSLLPGIQLGNAECVELGWQEVLAARDVALASGEGPL